MILTGLVTQLVSPTWVSDAIATGEGFPVFAISGLVLHYLRTVVIVAARAKRSEETEPGPALRWLIVSADRDLISQLLCAVGFVVWQLWGR